MTQPANNEYCGGDRAEERLTQSGESHRIIRAILEVSLREDDFERMLGKVLDLVFSCAWFALEPRGAVFLADTDSGVLHMHAQRGLGAAVTGMCRVVPFGSCLCGRAAEQRATIFADGIDERHERKFADMHPHGHVCVPILNGDQLLGVLNLYVREGHVLTADQETFLGSVAHTLATVIERKRVEAVLAEERAALEHKVELRTTILRDEIRERRRVEAGLRESEQRLRQLTDASFEGIAIHRDGKLLEVNRRLLEMLGVEDGTVVGRQVLDFVAPEYRDAIKARLHDPTGEPMDLVCLRADGKRVPVEIRAKDIQYQGRPARVTAIRDVAEQHRVQTLLQQRTAELVSQKFALDQHSIVAITDRRGRITYLNDKFCQISGYSHKELLGQDHRLLNSGHHPRAFFKEMWATIGRGRVWRGEIRNRRKNGTYYWVDTTIVPFKDEAGRPYQYVAIRTDISERKREQARQVARQARLKEQQRVLLALARNPRLNGGDLDEALALITAAAAEALVVERVGVWFYTMERNGIECADLYVRSGAEHAHGGRLARADYPDYFHALEDSRAIVAHDAYTHPATRAFTDGYLSEYGIGAMLDAPILVDGEVTGVVCCEHVGATRRWDLDEQQFAASIADLVALAMQQAERRRAEQAAIKARDEALAASRAKSEFIANVSHEIRTPMNGIMGMTELLSGTELDRDQREYLETIARSADQLMRTLNDILDLSRIVAGGTALEAVGFDPCRLLEDAVQLAAPRAQRKGLRIAAVVSRELPAQVVGDPDRLRQVVNNLLNNAVKFTSHGQVVLRASVLEHEAAAVRLRVEVEDTGIGIAPADRERIFESFQQADGAITRRFGGTGLGLAIARQLVEVMGGHIGVDGEPGRGARFWFEVPLAAPAPAARSGAVCNTEPGGPGGLRVLAVADPPYGEALVEQWATLGAFCENVADPAAACDALDAALERGVPYGLVMVECPGADAGGDDPRRRIRACAAGNDLPILVMVPMGQTAEVDDRSESLALPARRDRLAELAAQVK